MTYWSRDGLRQISVEEFAADKESRTLARTYLPDGGYVSTVWLGFDNGSGGAPLIYESMKFPEQDDCERYSTPAQALAGHSAMVLKHALKGWTETRAVLEDLMHEKRPGETWVLKLLGLRTELADLLVKAVDRRFGECLQCHSDTCSPGCLRFKILSELDPAWLRAQIIRANFDAITEDRRRFPVYGPSNRPRNYAYQRSALGRLFQEVYSQDIVTAWRNAALLVNANPNAPDGTTYVMPNMDALDGPAPIQERSGPESHHPARESDKTTDTEPQI